MNYVKWVRFRVIGFTFISACSVAGCHVGQYAQLYVNSNPPLARIYDAGSDRFYGNTPQTVNLNRNLFEDTRVIPLIIEREDRKCFKREVVIVKDWYDSQLDAYTNQFSIYADLRC